MVGGSKETLSVIFIPTYCLWGSDGGGKRNSNRPDFWLHNKMWDVKGEVYFRFPKKPEILVPFDQLGNRIRQLEAYLNNLLSISVYRNHPETV